MYFTVTFDGVPIGGAEIEGWGVRAGWMAPLPAYAAFNLSSAARRLGIALLATRWRRVPSPVADRALRAAGVQMEALESRLGLVDAAGAAVLTPRIAVVEFPRRSALAGVYVMADLGEEGSGRAALRRSPPGGGENAARPTA